MRARDRPGPAAPAGQTGPYKGEDTEGTLRLLALNGDTPHRALTPTETELRALMPQMKTGKEAMVDADNSDNQSIDLPGVHIRARDHGA